MMDIKDQWQVCSLELSKRLKELGYPQKSLWYWYPIPEVIPNSGGALKSCGWEILYGNKARIYGVDTICSAPTSGELGIALPLNCDTYRTTTRFGCQYRPGYTPRKQIFADTEANARGLMWEYLKKNGLIKESNDV